MRIFKRKEQLTRLPDGSKPSYDDLEASFINVHKQLTVAKTEVKRLNRVVADMQYDLKAKDVKS